MSLCVVSCFGRGCLKGTNYTIFMLLKYSRHFHACLSLRKEVPKNLKGKSKSSQDWLTRQLNDPYVEKAKMMNYRCRSAFKLIEINDKYNILSPGQCAIDLGAAPGSWTQVLVNGTNSLAKRENIPVGFVVGIDRLPIYPIDGAVLINADFTSEHGQLLLKEKLKEKKVDIVLSDMAPNSTGIRSLDHENILNLAYAALRFSALVSVVGGAFIVKIWDGKGGNEIEKDLKKFYKHVKVVKPKASRGDSSEQFLLARDFRGLKSL